MSLIDLIDMLIEKLEKLKLSLIKNPDLDRPDTEPVINEKPSPPQKLLWYPLADTSFKMSTRGKYRKGYPEGAVVHFTAGSTMRSSLEWGKSQGYTFFGIDYDGKVFQTHPLDEWGSHAGQSNWLTVGSGVSQYFVGIEIANAGRLTKVTQDGKDVYAAWFHFVDASKPSLGLRKSAKPFTEDQVRWVNADSTGVMAGHYAKFTPEQEDSLIDLLKWLRANNPEVFKIENVTTHHEVSKGRKNDVGGSLSVHMNDLRQLLRSFEV